MTLWKMTYIIFHHFVVLVFFMLKKMGYNTCYCAEQYWATWEVSSPDHMSFLVTIYMILLLVIIRILAVI
jgi:hypothetical protein